MDFLRLLAAGRCGALDTFFSGLTYFGSEIAFMAAALLIFWCVDKRQGYYVFLVGALGTVCNQFLKLAFRIPRPWVLDPDFQIVEAARADAEKKAGQAHADFAAYREKVEGERREARVSELVKAGKVKPAEKASVLDFAARLAAQTDTVDFAAPDGTTEKVSLEERYLRELEARPVDERGTDFTAPPAHAGGDDPGFDYDKMASKL